jgi:four helix bundle protein
MSLDYIDLVYALAYNLPRSEEYNLKSQLTRAATSIALNIADGSTSQTDAEQARFVGLSIRSLIETIACQRIVERRSLSTDENALRQLNQKAESLLIKLQAFRKAIAPNQNWLREDNQDYSAGRIDTLIE